jgi:hypothetical protein|tara:strand:+ start:47 stop:325 length:279 start_codon:yes stop_codon:yes gene_type:complete
MAIKNLPNQKEKRKQKVLDLGCEDEWGGMPEFHQEDLTPWHQVNVRFKDQKDFEKFVKLMDQRITPKQKTLWFPYLPHRMASHFHYVDKDDT